MPTQALFVSETYLKDFTPLTQNVDVKDYLAFVKTAQDKYCADILGSKLYTRLQDGVINSNLTSDETDLVKLLRTMTAWYTLYEAMPFLNLKLKNKGILKSGTDFSTNADLAETRYLREEVKNQAEYYLQRVQDYLCKNGRLFSEYTNPDNPIAPNPATTYTGDLAFDEYDPAFLDLRFFRKYLQ